MRSLVLLAAACCTGAMFAASPAFQTVNLPPGVTGQKILSTPGGGFLVLATTEVLKYSSAGTLTSTWTAPANITDFTLDGQGNLYVVGTATGNVPIVNSSVPTGSGAKSFFLKLDSSYSNVLISALFGDSSTNANAIAADANGNIYLGGSTLATAFPNAFNFGGCGNCAFAVKFPPTADQIAYSVLLGGPTASCQNDGEGRCPGQPGNGGSSIPGSSGATAIAVDASGSLTVAGWTFSNFPVTANPVGGYPNAGTFSAGFAWQDGFVTRLDPTGSMLIYSTCFGASPLPGPGPISELGLTAGGDAVVAGAVSGVFASVPVPGSTTLLSGSNVFLATLNATGTALISELLHPAYGSFPVGSINDFAIDSSGNTWITGGLYVAEVRLDDSGIVWLSSFPGGTGGLSITAFGSGVLTLGANAVVYVAAPASISQVYGGVFNAISQQPELSVAPGEFVTVYGADLGGAAIDFNGVSAPLLYSGPKQINVIAPWNLTGPMNVSVNGVLVKSIGVGLAIANPQLLVLVNADGTFNSIAHPAPVGSVVTAFINGASYDDTTLANSALATKTIPLVPSASVSSGLTITYQGSAPGEINEVQQVNLLITAPQPNSRATLTQANSTLTFTLAVSP